MTVAEPPHGDVKGMKQVVLADAPDFLLGGLTVRPSIRSVTAAEGEIRLEPRVMQVLVALAEAKGGTVSRDALVNSCWSGVVVGDDAVNRVIGRLRRLSGEVGEAFRVETIPRVGFRLVPVENAVGDTPPAKGGETAILSSRSPHRRLWRSRAAFGGVAAAVAALMFFVPGVGAYLRPAERIAVLEFPGGAAMRADDFAARLAGRIRQVMSVNDLQVVARPDTPQFRGPGMSEAARGAGVGYVLDGAVSLEDGQQIVVRAELIDARKNLTLWSREFRRERSEDDYMLDQIATHSAYVLRCALVSRRARSGPQDPETLAAFLKACDRIHRYDGGRDEALESERAVIRRAPKFSRGWSMLAMSAAVASAYSQPDQAEALRAEALRAIKEAARLDRRNPEVFLAQATLLPGFRSWEEREALIAQSLRIDANYPDANAMLGDLYLQSGRMKDAVAAYQRAAAADPLSPMNQTNLVPALSGLGRQKQAAEMRDRLYRIWPTSPRVWMHRLHNAAFPGKVEDAAAVLANIDKAPFKMEDDLVDAFRLYLSAKISGDPAERRRAAERYVELALADRFDMAPAFSAMAEIGELDTAFSLAGTYVKSPWANSWALFGPATVRMRRDPRFMALAAEIGLVDYWSRSGHWPDFCGAVDLPYDCEDEAERILGKKVSRLN